MNYGTNTSQKSIKAALDPKWIMLVSPFHYLAITLWCLLTMMVGTRARFLIDNIEKKGVAGPSLGRSVTPEWAST